MKKIAILVIAAFNEEVYKHYINTYWTDLIKYTNLHKPNIDVYLLFDRDMSLVGYEEIIDNIIIDENTIYNEFVDTDKITNKIPGILSKTIHAFEILKDKVDVIFRTNLSSMLHLDKLEKHVENNNIIYSGAYGWSDALRSHLMYLKSTGEDSINSIDELESYEGNTFFSGCGYFLNKDEIRNIIDNKRRVRYDIIDDVSIGLMCKDYKVLEHFLIKITKHDDETNILKKLDENYIHIRLEHLPLEKAKEVYHLLKEKYPSYLPIYKEYQNIIYLKIKPTPYLNMDESIIPISSPQNQLKYYTIFGERNSGTNYLGAILNAHLKLGYTKKFGFKHWYIKNHYPRGRDNQTTDNECLENLENSKDTLFIFIVRNPYDWSGAMKAKPYHIKEADFSSTYNFISNRYISYENHLPSDHGIDSESPWHIDEITNTYFIDEAENLIELRNLKNNHFYELRNRVKYFHLIRQENLEEDIGKMIKKYNLNTTKNKLLLEYRSPKKYDLDEKSRQFIDDNLDNEVDNLFYSTPKKEIE